MVTGILLWDLSAQHTTHYARDFCEKLKVYGISQLSCNWFKSFLMGRTQCVEIVKIDVKTERTGVGCFSGGHLVTENLHNLYSRVGRMDEKLNHL